VLGKNKIHFGEIFQALLIKVIRVSTKRFQDQVKLGNPVHHSRSFTQLVTWSRGRKFVLIMLTKPNSQYSLLAADDLFQLSQPA
jgi:hypothetical protein